MDNFRHYFVALLFISAASMSRAQTTLHGVVTNGNGEKIEGATINLIPGNRKIISDSNGKFAFIGVWQADTLVVSHLGYQQNWIVVPTSWQTEELSVILRRLDNILEEVEVNTGYYSLPRERATGSFTHLDNEQLNRSIGPNIMDRLEGISSGLQFDRRNLVGDDIDGRPELRVRGLSTIEADGSPLIVLDGFPYDGDIMNINPNDVESVTILKDGAAASIWGAKAGNGVIVINSKQGRYGQPVQISANSNVNLGERPNLFYNQSFLPSVTVMKIQEELYNRGVFVERDQTTIPAFVELLIKKRDGLITNAAFEEEKELMGATDLRKQAYDHLYRRSLNQQHALSVRGGGENYRYVISAGHDRARARLIGNENNRTTLAIQNAFKVRPGLELVGKLNYTNQQHYPNGVSLPSGVDIYERLVEPNGNPAPVGGQYRLAYREHAESADLLPWLQYPLIERKLVNRRERASEIRVSGALHYRFIENFSLIASYQHTRANNDGRTVYDQDSYYVRNLVNRFTQVDGRRLIPHAGIINYAPTGELFTHSGRVQVDYDRLVGDNHRLYLLGGVEIRQSVDEIRTGFQQYGFDKGSWYTDPYQDFLQRFPTRPTGTAMIPMGTSDPDRHEGRFLSYYGNGSYELRGKYILSGSTRWDGSNLLGVKTNQRGTALWSLGMSWELSKEGFYSASRWLPYFRLRTTYGVAGNIDKTQSHYPTIQLGRDINTGLPFATIMHAGNPGLRWEQVHTANIAMDWRLKDERLYGSLEFYRKDGNHLLGNNMIDPSSGVGESFKMNYASLRTTGWDLELGSKNRIGSLHWNVIALISRSTNRITHIRTAEPLADNLYLNGDIREKGKSMDHIYSLPWYGLNSQTGYPLIYIDGQPSDNYQLYYQTIRKDQLVSAGVLVPPIWATLRNNFQWRGLNASILWSGKFGHVFQRSSIAPGQEYLASNEIYHMDYFRRWQKPGDEQFTDVPAKADTEVYGVMENARSLTYLQSKALITDGAYIRLQDINVGYTFAADALRSLSVKRLRLYAYVRNLVILWRANENGIDPEYPNANFPSPRTYAFGIQLEF